ncbi:hypothetical protein G7046_g4431 [Stylonectria norvegica]|nr:hypothetical protein G7046_g4431 [Stylonectria norvegica]
MTPNSENTMARFLLAIINQKNLKDIDWNKVASDPVLMQPITNGHAARMRFARFKSSVTGHEPQKRASRTEVRADDKFRVTKPKKIQPAKRDSLAKSESTAGSSPYTQVRSHSPKIKQEQNQPAYLAQFSPASNPSPYMTTDGRDDFNHNNNTRFLTPCSDDMSHTLAVNPASLEDVRQRNGFGPSMDCNPAFLHQANHDYSVLNKSPAYQTFEAEYDLSRYMAAPDTHSPGMLDNNGASLADCSPEWTDRFDDHIAF